MQLRYLDYLVVLAREQHFGRASRALQISQPALSFGIKQLEREFNTIIIDRDQAGFRGFTADGQAILDWARRTVTDCSRLMAGGKGASHSSLRGTLRIGVVPVAMAVISLLTTPFNVRCPNVSLAVIQKALTNIEHDLKAYELDIGITYIDGVTATGLRSYSLYDEVYYLLVPEGHYLEDRELIGWKEAGELPLCMLTPDLYNRVILDRVFADAGVRPAAVLETNCSLGLFTHIRSGKWLTIVPHSFFYLLGDWAFIRAIPLVDPVATNTMGLVIHDRNPMPVAVEAFVEAAQEARIEKQLARYRS